MSQGRFTAFPFPDSLVVLDTETGEVVRVPIDGSPSTTLRAGVEAHAIERPRRAEPPKATASMTAFDREVVATYPMPVASAYLAFLSERDPRQRARLLIDTFGITLKVWALALTSQYLASEAPHDALLDDLLAREFRRPLISTWDQSIQRGIAVLRDRGDAVFLRELGDAYQALETRCREPFLATVVYEDEEGRPREKRSKLGKVRALLRYRNTLAHGFVQKPEQAEAELALYEPLLVDVLRAGEFLRRYPLYSVEARESPGRVIARRWMGSEPPTETRALDVPVLDADLAPFFMRDEATGTVLPLHGFVDVERSERTGDEEVLLYDGLTRSAVIYVSSSGERVERAKRASSLAARLDAKAASPVAIVSPDAMTIDDLRGAAGRVTGATLDRLRSSGELIPEVVRPRAEVTEVLAGFDRGDHRGLVLAGEGGSGKTTVAASFAMERVAQGDVVVFYRGQDLVDADLDARLLRALMTRGMHFEDFLAQVSATFGAAEKRLYLVVDGVNETPGDIAALVRAFDALVLQADSFPWFRAVATIRTRSYERLPSRGRFGADPRARYVRVESARSPGVKEPFVTLSPLATAEVGEVYEAYRALRVEPTDASPTGTRRFRPLTPFAELDPLGSTCALMRNPLMLRVIVTAYHAKRLPPELRFDEAMDLYVEEMIVERGGRSGPYPERKRLLQEIVRAFDAASATSLSLDRLREIPALRRPIENTERDSAYVQLVELGVLAETWEGRECRVRFAFDRLFEDQLARILEPDLEEPADLCSLAARATTFASVRGALAIVLARATHHGRAEWIARALRLAREGRDDVEGVLFAAVTDALTALARCRDPSTAELLDTLRHDPSEPLARLLLEVVDRLTRAGEVHWVDRLLETTGEMVGGLGLPGLEAEHALRQALLLHQRGEWSGALQKLDVTRTGARGAGDDALAMRAELLSGEILRSRGALDEASAIFDRASTWFTEHGELARAAEARRQQAIVEGARGSLEARRRLVTEAVELAERAGDRDAEFRCRLSLGQTHRLLGESEGAVRWFGEALAAAEAIGNVRLVANALLGLGVALRESKKRSDADALFARAVELLERVDDKQKLAAAVHNLALARMDAGRLDEALDLSRRSVALYQALGEQGDVIEAKNLLGSILGAKGIPDRAREAHEEALATARSTGHAGGMQNALFHLGCLDASAGKLVEARASAALLEELRSKEPSPLADLTCASLRVVLAATDSTNEGDLERETKLLATARERVTSVQDVHAGPAVAWLVAARRFLRDGHVSLARACLRELEVEIDGRWYPGVRELVSTDDQTPAWLPV